MMKMKREEWSEIVSGNAARRFPAGELLAYKDLIFLFVKRDFIALYKQTILGPLWILLQPLLTTITYALIFGVVAKIETGVPFLLFYLSGIILWTFFSETLIKSSETFSQNQQLFGKVYFPRLVVPVSIWFTNLIKLGIHLFLLIIIYAVIVLNSQDGLDFGPGIYLLWVPLVILLTGIFGIGLGLIISALTVKYRDIKFMVVFGVQLLMFLTPVVYPLSIASENVKQALLFNPITVYVEIFKKGLFGDSHGHFDIMSLIFACTITFVVLFLGLFWFRRSERNFIDTI